MVTWFDNGPESWRGRPSSNLSNLFVLHWPYTCKVQHAKKTTWQVTVSLKDRQNIWLLGNALSKRMLCALLKGLTKVRWHPHCWKIFHMTLQSCICPIPPAIATLARTESSSFCRWLTHLHPEIVFRTTKYLMRKDFQYLQMVASSTQQEGKIGKILFLVRRMFLFNRTAKLPTVETD